MLLFETFEIFLSFRKVLFRTNHFLRLVIENCSGRKRLATSLLFFHHFRVHTDEVSVLEIESIELIACLFGVVHVFVDNKRGSLGVVCDTLTYLPMRRIDNS